MQRFSITILLCQLGVTGCLTSDAVTSTSAELEAAPPAVEQLELWLDGSRGVGLAGKEVMWWDDQSGNGHTMVRGSPDRPSVTVAKYPGTERLGILFQPESTLDGGYLVNSGVVLRQPFTVALVIRPLPHPDEAIPFTGLSAPTVTIARRTEPFPIPGNDEFRATSGGGPSYTAVGVPHSWDESSHVVIATYAGAASRLRVDAETDRGALLDAPLTGVALSAGGRTFRGYIGEVLVYRGVLGRPTEAELAAYLSARFPH